MVIVTLPYPPSANRLWRAVKGRQIKSAEYRTWIVAAVAACGGAGTLVGPYRLRLIADRPDKRRRDIDNLLKPVSDALKAAGVVQDDSDAVSVSAEWSGEVLPGGRVVVGLERAA